MLRIKQKCSGSAIDSVTGSTIELSRLTNHPRHHSGVISLRSCDSAEMQSVKGIYLPARFCWLLGSWATLASHTRKQNRSRNFKSHQLIGRDWGIKFSYCQVLSFTSVSPFAPVLGLFMLSGWRALQFKIKVIMYHFKLYSFIQTSQILCQFIWGRESIFSFVIKSKFTTKYLETTKLKMSKLIQVLRKKPTTDMLRITFYKDLIKITCVL